MSSKIKQNIHLRTRNFRKYRVVQVMTNSHIKQFGYDLRKLSFKIMAYCNLSFVVLVCIDLILNMLRNRMISVMRLN